MAASTILPLTLRLSLRSRSTYHNQHQLQLQLKRTTLLSPPLTKPLACLSTLSTTTSLATNTKRLLLPQQQQQPHSSILNSSSIRNKSTNNLDYNNNTKITIGNDNNNDIIDNNTRKFSSSGSRNSSANDNATNTKSNSNANANPNEVDKFTSFASHWWDSRSNPLVGMNPIRVKFMMETVAKELVTTSNPSATNNNNNNNNIAANHNHRHHHLPLRNKRVLDIGCGGGLLTESFSRLGASLVAGVDASPKVVEVAKIHSFHDNNNLTSSSAEWNESKNTNDTGNNKNSNTPEERKIMYIGGKTVEEFASHWLSKHEQEHNQTTTTTTTTTTTSPTSSRLNNNTSQFELFDVITTLEVIEHVPNPSSLLHAATSLLKPGGILFVSTINRTAKSYGVAIVGAEYVTGMVPVGTHDWNQFWSPEEVRGMVCGSGAGAGDSGGTMKQIAVNGMVVNPLNMEWSLDASDVDVNWIGAYQKKGMTRD